MSAKEEEEWKVEAKAFATKNNKNKLLDQQCL